MTINRRDLLGVSEVAKLLGKHPRTVQRMAENGELPTIGKMPGITGAYLFDRAAIEEHLEPAR